MTDLANRYGTPSRARRTALIALATALAVAGLGWLAWAAVYQSTPEVQSELVGFRVEDEHTATAEIDVDRDSTDVSATCFLRAISEDHEIVGELTLAVGSGPEEQRVEATVRTSRRATTIESLGCIAPGQPQRR